MILAYLQDSNWHNKTSLPSRQQKISSSGMLVLGHKTAKGRRGQSNLLWLFQKRLGQHESYAQREQIVHFLGQNSEVRILVKR